MQVPSVIKTLRKWACKRTCYFFRSFLRYFYVPHSFYFNNTHIVFPNPAKKQTSIYYFFDYGIKLIQITLTSKRVGLFLKIFSIIFYCLCCYSCPDFSLWPSSKQTPLPQVIPTLLSTSMVMYIYILWLLQSPWLFCNNQFVLLNPFTFPSPNSPAFWQLSL